MAVRLVNLTFLILEINAALDTGKYDDISIEDVRVEIRRGNVLKWLKIRLGDDIDLSLYLDSNGPRDGFASWYEAKLQEILGGYEGRERRKWGIENRGLCLLIAWTNEMIQQREGIDFSKQ